MLTQNLHLLMLKYQIVSILCFVICVTTLLINIKASNEIIDI